jgi:hypothetical protein
MSSVAKNIEKLPVGAVRNLYLEFTDQLSETDLLTGTPTVSEVSRSDVDAGVSEPSSDDNDFTLDNAGVNAAAYINQFGETVAIGKAVVFRLATSGVDAGEYAFRVSVTTNNTSAETLIGYIRVNITGS